MISCCCLVFAGVVCVVYVVCRLFVVWFDLMMFVVCIVGCLCLLILIMLY